MKMSAVNVVFYDLIDYLYLNLFAMEKFSFELIEICSDFNPPFTEQWLKKIHDCKSLFLFKIYTLPFITWLDHSVLNDLVVAIGSKDAQELLDSFDYKINSYSDHPITSFPILSPSQLMIPLDDSKYTLLAMKFLSSSQYSTESVITLKDIMDIKQTMELKWNISSVNIQLVAVHAKLELLYWMIPKCLVKAIEGNLVHHWQSKIIMVAILPENFHNLENCNERIEGPFSSLNYFWQDNTEVNKK